MGNTGSAGGGGGGGGSRRWHRGRRRSSCAGLSLNDFQVPRGFMSNIGVGGFGRVLAMVRRDDPKRHFAIKCLHKAKVVHKGQVDNCLNELAILRRLDHYAYLVNLFYAFQDRHYLYMCTDLMLGGTLQRAMKKTEHGTFADEPERICRYAAELTLALQFLHSQNVVHRDIKPENILLDANGHLHLTDFNVSIYVEPGNEKTQKHEDGWGTRGYRAPEVYLRTGRGFIFACDWWSMGAVLFELFTGRVPYPKLSNEESSSELLMRMNAECADFDRIRDEMARDFLAKLLRFDPEARIGCQDGCNSEVMIMSHPFFKAIDWDVLENYTNPGVVESETANTSNTAAASRSTTDEGPGAMALLGIEGDTGPPLPSPSSPPPLPGGAVDLGSFAGNFDASLDQKEKLKILQRNMGILGLDGLDGIDDEDEDDFRAITDEQQELFKDWAYNVDFKLEQRQRPQFTLLQTVSSMSPAQIKQWIATCSNNELGALCSEMKAYREQAMKENYEHVMAQWRIDKLIDDNLRLTRRIAQLEGTLVTKDVAPTSSAAAAASAGASAGTRTSPPRAAGASAGAAGAAGAAVTAAPSRSPPTAESGLLARSPSDAELPSDEEVVLFSTINGRANQD